LLNVPHWDFNWQLTYVLSEPLALPEGTEILCAGMFDNSLGNRVNRTLAGACRGVVK